MGPLRPSFIAAALLLCALMTRGAFAGAHTWKVNEVYTDATGLIQFIELRESGGGTTEIGTGGRQVTSSSQSYTITSNVASPTTFKSILIATPGYAALSGVPVPDFIIPAGSVPFFDVTFSNNMQYVPFDSWVIPADTIPTDGTLSYNRSGGALTNSPTNYAGVTGTVNLTPPAPPAVPDGGGPGQPMTVTPLDTSGSSLQIHWDTATCDGDSGFHIVYGQKTDLPAAAAGAFHVTGGVCGIAATPFTWNAVPSPTDGFGLLWWMILANDGSTTEGSWGQSSANVERTGPGPDGNSGVCGITQKVLINTCGN
jgi:hypothetical protein